RERSSEAGLCDQPPPGGAALRRRRRHLRLRAASDGGGRAQVDGRHRGHAQERPLREGLLGQRSGEGSAMSASALFLDTALIVTGAAQGIGRSVALRVAAEGGRVLAVDRSGIVEEVAAEVVAAGGVAVAFQADLETYAGAAAMAAECVARFGGIDV